MADEGVSSGAGAPPVRAPAADPQRTLRVRYLLRVVRIGVLSTFVVMVPLSLYPFVATQAPVDRPLLYAVVICVGLLGAAGVARLPWDRLLNGPLPMLAFSLWSVADIALISLLVLVTGGITSPLWAVYALTTLFFAAAYPRGIQIVMLGFTALAYAWAVGLGSPPVWDHAGELGVRVGILATLALMGGFISGELTRQMALQARRATASRQVAEAGTQIATLRHQGIFDAATDALVGLGFSTCAVVVVEGRTYRITAARGLPPDFERVRLASSDLRPGSQAWVMHPDDIDDPGVRELLRTTGADALIAAPLSVGSRRVGLLFALGDDEPVATEAMQTLATLVGNALENAELYRMKADFVANVSHELRTPLTVLVGLGETLARRAAHMDSERTVQLGERVEANAARLDAMISRLLDIARLETPQRSVDAEDLDAHRLATEAVERTAARLAPRRAEVAVEGDVWAVGDQLMIEQVLDNLLANVAAHTPPGTRARVAVRRIGDEVEVAVTDDGPGIAPEDEGQVTERFFRGGDHLTRDTSGLGLGLALAQELLTLHESGLEISRAPEGGTRVAFRLAAGTPPGRGPHSAASSRARPAGADLEG